MAVGACGVDDDETVVVEAELVALFPASLRNCIVDRAVRDINRKEKKRARGEMRGGEKEVVIERATRLKCDHFSFSNSSK